MNLLLFFKFMRKRNSTFISLRLINQFCLFIDLFIRFLYSIYLFKFKSKKNNLLINTFYLIYIYNSNQHKNKTKNYFLKLIIF